MEKETIKIHGVGITRDKQGKVTLILDNVNKEEKEANIKICEKRVKR